MTAAARDYMTDLVARVQREERERVLEHLRDRLALAEQVSVASRGDMARAYASGYADSLRTAIESLEVEA